MLPSIPPKNPWYHGVYHCRTLQIFVFWIFVCGIIRLALAAKWDKREKATRMEYFPMISPYYGFVGSD